MSSITMDSIEPNDNATPDFIPNDHISHRAFSYAKAHLHEDILNHSLRVYKYAQTISRYDLSDISRFQPTAGPSLFATKTTSLPDHMIFVASIFHDIGTVDAHDHAQRFEICGADAAVEFLHAHGEEDSAALREVWMAIALHTSPGIAERMSPLTRVLRMAVKADFGDRDYRALLGQELVEEMDEMWFRGDVEKVLGDCVAAQGVRREGDERNAKAPKTSWPWNLMRCEIEEPRWQGVNKGF